MSGRATGRVQFFAFDTARHRRATARTCVISTFSEESWRCTLTFLFSSPTCAGPVRRGPAARQRGTLNTKHASHVYWSSGASLLRDGPPASAAAGEASDTVILVSSMAGACAVRALALALAAVSVHLQHAIAAADFGHRREPVRARVTHSRVRCRLVRD
jgi:hypothetical protein